jgi:hypothetical protein
MNGGRSMRAVKDSPAIPLKRSKENWKGLAQRPQSKAPHTLAWLGIELEKRVRVDARSEGRLATA